MPQSTVPVSDHDFAITCHNTGTGQKLLLSAVHLHTGAIITSFCAAEIRRQPSRYTVQVNNNEHIVLQPAFIQYINHSCSPNVFFDTSGMQLLCIKNISPGDEITFFYPSTEWNMVEPFHCYCGHAGCIGMVRGAAYLSASSIRNYRYTHYIQHRLQEVQRKPMI